MTDRTDALAQALFNKSSLHDCSLQQVDYLAHQYPYFSTAQLLLLQKLEKNPEESAKQLQRTALHFSNPLQLNYWLEPALFETEMPEAELFENPIPDKKIIQETIEEQKPFRDEAIVKQEPVAEKEPQPATPPEPTAMISAIPQPENPALPEAGAITFEPYHTVDYFASQGIKLSQQEASNDALGKQLKSFTEWLKTMKRLPEKTTIQNMDTAGEQKIENLAAHSLDAADVVTESMAEVWLKQGKGEKAAEVYRKLSLQNPSKSAYFAAKIESLKKV